MRSTVPDLDQAVQDGVADGYCIHAASSDANQLYLSGFDAPGPFFTCYTPDDLAILVSGLEYGRAKSESQADTVARFAEYEYQSRVEEFGQREGRVRVCVAFLEDLGVESVLVPDRFPVAIADGLREHGIELKVDDEGYVEAARAVKTETEIEQIELAQAANETALGAAEDLLAASEPRGGVLYLNGDPLTSERVKEEIEVALLREGCALDETIVAGGREGADPHERGSGPLPADEPIIIDVFPKDKSSKYHADMTRTFVRGEPGAEVKDRFEVVDQARVAALEVIEPGVTGATIHDEVCDVLEEAGYETLRSDPNTETGFIHSTGHGIGLDVHEAPSLSPQGEELKPGHVVTVEPGLYDPAVGGIRIEDLAVVTDDGCRNLTEYPVELRV